MPFMKPVPGAKKIGDCCFRAGFLPETLYVYLFLSYPSSPLECQALFTPIGGKWCLPVEETLGGVNEEMYGPDLSATSIPARDRAVRNAFGETGTSPPASWSCPLLQCLTPCAQSPCHSCWHATPHLRACGDPQGEQGARLEEVLHVLNPPPRKASMNLLSQHSPWISAPP